jgi:polar amino acid transport system permease protein
LPAPASFGFRFVRTLRLVIIPQVVRQMLPPTVGS